MLNAVKDIMLEHKKNYLLIIKLAIMNMEKQTLRSSLGVLWNYFHDIVYILVFIMFRLLISGYGDIMGMNSIIYLLTGLIPWFFISDVLNQGSRSIKNNRGIVQSLRFPIVVLPTIEVLSIFIRRYFTFFLLLIASTLFGYLRLFSIGLFLYYFICLFLLMISINWILSALVAVSEDFHQLYLAFVRVMIYSLPVMWSFEKVNNLIVQILLRINPMVYVINGFRNAFILGGCPNILYTIYFWICIAIFTIAGSFIQYKLRRYYSDFI